MSHTESGDRNEQAAVTTNWVFGGDGWEEKSTKATTDKASNVSFASRYDISWNVAGIPEEDGADTFSKGSFVETASDSHDYTSSSEITKASMKPVRMPGHSSGSVTRRKARHGVA